MSLLDALRYRVRVLVRRDDFERDLDDEMRFHLSLGAMHAAGEGLSESGAYRAARRRYGNVTYLKEESRTMAGLTVLDALRQDLRQALRGFLRAPGFTVAAVLTLAIGIGASTAVFSVIDGVLLRGLPYRDVGRLMNLVEVRDDGAGRLRLPSYPTFQDWQRDSTTWRGVLEGMAFVRGSDATLIGEKGPERLLAGFVTPGFFELMGARPLIGRTFLPDEERSGANRVAVLSYPFWRSRFGGDPAVVGRRIVFGGVPTTVVGVMPRGFAYPYFAMLWEPIAPIERTDSALMKRGVHSDARLVGRLRAGADSATAVAALAAVARSVASAHPAEQEHWTSAALFPLRSELLGDTPQMLFVLGGAVVLVLLLACVNVANLSLVRASARGRELAVRAALGAKRSRLVRQLVTESVVLAAAGGALGVALAMALVRGVRTFADGQIPRASELTVDGRVLAFAIAATLFAALVAGIAPAFRATRPALVGKLRAGTTGAIGGARDARVRGVLVTAQFALAVMLLIGAGLLVQSFRRIAAVPLGFDPDGRVAIALYPPDGRYATPEQALALYQRVLDRVSAVPGVRSAAVINHLPLTGASVASPVRVEGRADTPGGGDEALYRTASAGYASAMGLRILRGRWFTDDDIRAPDGFVINETMAKRLWPGQDPLGQRITLRRSSQARPDFGKPIAGPVIGVVADVAQFRRDRTAGLEVYVPYSLEVWPWISLVVHAADADRVVPALRRAVLDVEPAMPVAANTWFLGGFLSYDRLLATADGAGQRRFALSMIGAFAAFALVLAAIGMYGVISYGVAQRTREVGVRIALGASTPRILRLVVGEALVLAALGAVVGLAGAYAASRFITSQLYATRPADPATYVLTPLLLTLVALAASWIPARRAARLDPTIAIRGG